MRNLVLTILLFTLLLGLPGCGDDDAGPTLTFTAIPGEKPAKLREKFTPFARYLERTLGVPVRYVPSNDYPASVRMFVNADVQLAWFGGVTSCQARKRVPGSRAIAQGAEDPLFFSYFIAHKDTGIKRSNEFPLALAGKQFTFGSRSSTSGRLMPEYYIRKVTGKSSVEFFGHPDRFSGAHDKTARAVATGADDAGALSYKTYDRMVAAGEIDPEVCRVVWVTPEYADYNFTAHPQLEETFGAGFTVRLQKAILAYDDEDVLTFGFQRTKFIPATNADFESIRKLAEEFGLLD